MREATLVEIAREVRAVSCQLNDLAARLEAASQLAVSEPPARLPQRLLRAADVAELLGVPKARVYALAREGRFPGAVRIGRGVRFEPAAVQAWLRQGGGR